MITFVLLAATLTVAGVILVALPLLRRGALAPASWAALGAAAVLVAGSALLYVTWSNWSWRPAAPGDNPQTMVAQLARQLEQDPKNLEGWLMLGRSYLVLQEYPLAVRAFQRADRLSESKNPEALLGEAQALALTDESELNGRAGRLIEQALLIAPDSGKALFFGATTAARRGDLPLARQRFTALLALNPPDTVRPLIEAQIQALDEKIAANANAAPAAVTQPAAPGAQASIRVTITLAPAVNNGAAAPLFVFVRRAGEGGPPLAAKRLEAHFPQSVTLTPADAMIPGRSFAAGQTVQVVARIARSGSPVGASGDPFGELTYRVGQDGALNLTIDRLMP